MTKVSSQPLNANHTLTLARAIMNDKQAAEFERTKECNFAISPPGIGRFRVNAFMQQGKVGMVMRVIPAVLPTLDGLGMPQVLKDVVLSKRGLVILVGSTGSGKSTTMAAMLDWRNEQSFGHIITTARRWSMQWLLPKPATCAWPRCMPAAPIRRWTGSSTFSRKSAGHSF